MKKMIFGAIMALGALTACQSGGGGAEALAEAASAADSVVKPWSVSVADNSLRMTVNVPDTLFAPSALGENLMRFLAAARLRQTAPEEVNTVVHALRDTKGMFIVDVCGAGAQASFELEAEQLLSLRKASNLDLDLPAVKNDVRQLAAAINTDRFMALKGVVGVSTSFANGFIEYNVQWSSDQEYSKNSQGLLTARYFGLLKGEYRALESLCPDFAELLKGIGIEGVRVVYSVADAPAGAKELKQGFPWRVLAEQ